MRVLVESNYGTTTKPDGLGAVCKLVCSPKRNFYWYGNDMELNSRLGPDIRQCGTREELLEKLNRRKKNYEIRLQNLSSDLFLNQKGKVVFENCLKQDILMYTTFIEALEKQQEGWKFT